MLRFMIVAVHSAGMQSISCDLEKFQLEGYQNTIAAISSSRARLCCQGFCRLHSHWIGSSTLRFMIVAVHSAGMQSMFWDET